MFKALGDLSLSLPLSEGRTRVERDWTAASRCIYSQVKAERIESLELEL